MFNKKEEVKHGDILPKVEMLTCDTCGCYVNPEVAVKVKYEHYAGNFTNVYCLSHKPKYESVVLGWGDSVIRYYKKCEVDINGEPIKNKKTK